MAVVYDHREQRSGVPFLLATEGVEVRAAALPAGDYVLSDRLAVERKSAQDLVASIVSGRVFEQLERLTEAYPSVVLLVQDGPAGGLSDRARAGALAWALRQGVGVLTVADEAACAQWLALLARQEGAPARGVRGRARKDVDPSRAALELVAGLPGVSAVRARALLDAFGSIAELCQAGPEQLQRVSGIGPKTAQAVYAVLTARRGG